MDAKFKEAFWKWFDNLPVKAKHTYMYMDRDLAEVYFKEFFYKKS